MCGQGSGKGFTHFSTTTAEHIRVADRPNSGDPLSPHTITGSIHCDCKCLLLFLVTHRTSVSELFTSLDRLTR